MTGRATAQLIGRVGVWLGALGWVPAADARRAATEIENLGYGALWVGEGHLTKEVFTNVGLLLAAAERLPVVTAIANIWVRDATAMNAAANTLAEAYPGRFVLGLGASHARQVDHRGHEYRKPLAAMGKYLDDLDAAEYGAPAPAIPVPRVLAALRPRMLELARDRAAGAHPYLVPVEHTARAREILGEEPLLAPEQAVVLEEDPVVARRIARAHLRFYLGLPNYVNNLLACGFTDEDVASGGSDRLVDRLVAWGGAEAIRSRVAEHLAAGADHVAIHPLGEGRVLCQDQLRELAPALLEVTR
ncbi:putative F420-dependent oxidoreductase [Nonomuraea thailandensis]|uniref:F420-dependent oxidoreductase n=2 Tax=Nonomuraea thailandensis TaxID=1188745 RepID=A0A9X2JYW6_9ACTN|nr:LLM class F420-dependent oxidoreductase [Nonomuraea thailandensis]MCP2353559.1 putative F420-dependent oxidoreductase [Nonomuraea thailandensis]